MRSRSLSLGFAENLYPGARAAPALATGEARGAAGGGGVDGVARIGLEGQALVQRQAQGGDGRAAVGEHRLLGEGGERLGVLEGAVERAAVDLGDEAHAVGL